MGAFFGEEPPLADYGKAAAGYGHANFIPDPDQIFRHQPLIARKTTLVETMRLDSLKPGYTVDSASSSAWLGWTRTASSTISTHPYREVHRLAQGRDGEARRPQGRQQPRLRSDEQYYIVRKYKDSFIPSITLSLAANYFGVKLSDIDVVLGEGYPHPLADQLRPGYGRAKALRAAGDPRPVRQGRQSCQGGIKRTLDKIDIPIDSNGDDAHQFHGPPSSDSADGVQTYPVRSYAGYAEKAPGPEPGHWRRTMAVGNKIVMVGAFSAGMAADQKTTPLRPHVRHRDTRERPQYHPDGQFPQAGPRLGRLLILAGLVFLVAFMSSRLSTVLSFFGTLVLIVGFFFATTMIFDYRIDPRQFQLSGPGHGLHLPGHRRV